MEIQIGADELILWLRKNEKCLKYGNIVIGRKIAELMKKLGGKFAERNEQTVWKLLCVEEKLPQTSQQYIIDVDKLPDLFRELSSW